MSPHAHDHRAWYDADGNIVLGGTPHAAPKVEPRAAFEPQSKPEPRIQPASPKKHQTVWTVMEETTVRTTKAIAPVVTLYNPPKSRDPRKPSRAQLLLRISVKEGRDQYKATARSATKGFSRLGDEVVSMPRRVRGSLKKFWAIATTPVKVPSRFTSRKRTKAELFLVDTVRFGGTFGLIFAVLFVGINYQSFWQIARAQLAIGDDLSTEQALTQISRGPESTGMPTFVRSGASDGQNILKYLPAVGPYEDRIIIPKIGKNVPIVQPAMDALVKEDWKKFEEDIQGALHHGVVHYPGSARPGQAGNFFVTGHSSYYPWDDGFYKDVFARLHELDLGDTYTVYYGGDKHTYRVTKKYEVKPTDVNVLDQPTDKRIATLMTCTPVGTTLRRLIVQAEEINPETGIALKVGQKVEDRAQPFSRLDALPI